MFNGKALYNPHGRSGEYSQWAVNFYNGCTGSCEYCYNRRFPILSAPKPTLKACFTNETDAFNTAEKELISHKEEIVRDGGVFLSFVSDPFLKETACLTAMTIIRCSDEKIPVIILTKQTAWAYSNILPEAFRQAITNPQMTKEVAYGFTLTGHDELEPGCSPNANRIKAMKDFHDVGFRTWASIEPIIDFRSSLEMIHACAPFCNHFKIGIRTDRKFSCTEDEIVNFVNDIRETVSRTGSTVYFKQSFRNLVGGGYIIGSNFVEEGYNMFTQNYIQK